MIILGKKYKVYSSDRALSKNGQPYYRFKIKDNVADKDSPSGWRSTYYKVYAWGEYNCPENGEIIINKMYGVGYSERYYNGKYYVECSISCKSDGLEVVGEDIQATNAPDFGGWDAETPFDFS